MKSTLTLLALALLTTSGHAQCEAAIPANATVVDADATISNGGNYWLCTGVTVQFTGFAPFVYIEDGCTVIIDGLLGAFTANGTCSITVNGDNNNVIYEVSSTFIDNGTSNISTVCADVVFDYDDAPTPGCAGSTGMATPAGGPALTLFPDPAQDHLHIDLQGAPLLGVQLVDMAGRAVGLAADANGVVDLSGVEPGRYVVAVRSTTGIAYRTLVVQ